jgi:hypothetical protein
MAYNKNSGYGLLLASALHGIGPVTGKVFLVGDASTVNAAQLESIFGPDPDGVNRWYSTIDAAVGACVADRGDLIVVCPGHTETVTAAAGLDLDVAGITIVGIGRGSLTPIVNFTTAVGADMDVDAANISVKNIRFTGGIDALTGPIDVNAANFTMLDCVTEDVTGQATDFIVADANADGLLIDGWDHRGASAAGADTALTFGGADNVTVRNFRIDGNFAVAAIENTAASVNVRIYGEVPSFARTRNAADVIVTLHASTTGDVGPNIYARLQDNAANITEAFVGAAAQFFQPIAIVNLAGESSMQTNITASTDA